MTIESMMALIGYTATIFALGYTLGITNAKKQK